MLAGQTMHMDHIHFRIILVAIHCHISANMFRTSLSFRFALLCSTSNHTPDRYLLFTQSHISSPNTHAYTYTYTSIYIRIFTHLLGQRGGGVPRHGALRPPVGPPAYSAPPHSLAPRLPRPPHRCRRRGMPPDRSIFRFGQRVYLGFKSGI